MRQMHALAVASGLYCLRLMTHSTLGDVGDFRRRDRYQSPPRRCRAPPSLAFR